MFEILWFAFITISFLMWCFGAWSIIPLIIAVILAVLHTRLT